MTRRILILLICFSPFAADTVKIQLQSIKIVPTSNMTGVLEKGIECADIVNLEFCSHQIQVEGTCVGGPLVNSSNSLVLFVSAKSNATLNLPDKIKWTMEFNKTDKDGKIIWEQPFSDDLPNPSKDNDVNQIKIEEQTYDEITNSSCGKVTMEFTYMKMKTETVTESKNTQAVVVAVLEGLILGAILILFIYRQCFLKQKQQRAAATGGGFSGPGGNVGNSTGGTNYYDNAAVAYRQNNTTRNESYGYDQPPIRLEDRTRSTEQTRPSEPTNGRVETDSPSLVPVPLDPLTQWNDSRNGTAPDRLFS